MSSQSLPTVILRPGEAPRVLAGHPWVFKGNILRITRLPEPGEVAQVKDHRNRFLGVGYFNENSKIRVRLLSNKRRELDKEFLNERFQKALSYRNHCYSATECQRIIHSEGDFLSGLTIDRFGSHVVVQTSSLGMDQRMDILQDIIRAHLEPQAIWERNDLPSRKMEGLEMKKGLLWHNLSSPPSSIQSVSINNLKMEIDFLEGHKTGCYLDQQLNYERVASYCKNKKVLDCFSFQGSFALHAAKADALEVLGLEQNPRIVEQAARNAQENGLASRCRFAAANVFDWMKEKTQPKNESNELGSYDVVILDPPSFTRTKAALPEAVRGYKEIHLRAMKLLKPGGLLFTFCCSHHVSAQLFESIILESAYDARKILRRMETFSQAPDHPILPSIPETEYLKGFGYEVSEPH